MRVTLRVYTVKGRIVTSQRQSRNKVKSLLYLLLFVLRIKKTETERELNVN